MSEPDWQKFKIDPIFDNEGTQQVKLKGFMAAFIEWRGLIREYEYIPKMSTAMVAQMQKASDKRVEERITESKGLESTERKTRKTRRKRS